MAIQAKYKPRVLHDFANHMIREIEEGYLEISNVLEDICDAYEKLGYMFYARKIIEELDLRIPYSALVRQYHLLNFLFHCKAFIDSISNAIYHAFDLGIKKVVNIDITRPEFTRKLEMAEKLDMADKLKEFVDWAKYIVKFRVALIHKYRFFGLSKNRTLTKLEILREPISPLDFFDKKCLDEFSNKLKMKYGSSTIQFDDFCKEHLSNATDLFEAVISEFLEEIRNKGPEVIAGWKRIQPSHVGEAKAFTTK